MIELRPTIVLDSFYLQSLGYAQKARENAYAPYSKFKVGCSLLDEDGNHHMGCNVENASFPLSLCAERAAISNMVLCGSKPVALFLIGSSDEPCVPCGGCLQVLQEFGDMVIYCFTQDSMRFTQTTVKELLTRPFVLRP